MGNNHVLLFSFQVSQKPTKDQSHCPSCSQYVRSVVLFLGKGLESKFAFFLVLLFITQICCWKMCRRQIRGFHYWIWEIFLNLWSSACTSGHTWYEWLISIRMSDSHGYVTQIGATRIPTRRDVKIPHPCTTTIEMGIRAFKVQLQCSRFWVTKTRRGTSILFSVHFTFCCKKAGHLLSRLDWAQTISSDTNKLSLQPQSVDAKLDLTQKKRFSCILILSDTRDVLQGEASVHFPQISCAQHVFKVHALAQQKPGVLPAILFLVRALPLQGAIRIQNSWTISQFQANQICLQWKKTLRWKLICLRGTTPFLLNSWGVALIFY